MISLWKFIKSTIEYKVVLRRSSFVGFCFLNSFNCLKYDDMSTQNASRYNIGPTKIDKLIAKFAAKHETVTVS